MIRIRAGEEPVEHPEIYVDLTRGVLTTRAGEHVVIGDAVAVDRDGRVVRASSNRSVTFFGHVERVHEDGRVSVRVDY